MEISAPPQGPTTSVSTEAMELSGSAASSSLVITPKLNVETETKSASTEKKPMTVARPTSVRVEACLE